MICALNANDYLNLDNVIRIQFWPTDDGITNATITTTATDGRQSYEETPVFPTPYTLILSGPTAEALYVALRTLAITPQED